jgi:phosphatidylserine synthase
MVTTPFTIIFIATIILTLALFALGEIFKKHINTFGGFAAITEALVFLLIAWVFYHVNWGGTVPPWLMALFAIGGAGFSLNMAYKRFTGKPL